MTEPQLWVSVFEIGAFYSLIALSYLLVLQGAGFFNFAIGPYAMVAGLGTSWLVLEHDYSLPAAAAISLAAAIALSTLTEVVIIRRIVKRSGGGELPALVAVAAIIFAVQQAAGLLFGRRDLPGQRLVTFHRVRLGDAIIQPTSILLVSATAVMFAATAGWVKLSRSGRMLRAVGDHQQAAVVLGLPVSRVRLVAFAISGFIAGLAGLLFSPKAGAGFERGLTWTIGGFLALVIGGTGTPLAPLLGGFVLAGTQVFVPYYLGGASTDYALLGWALLFFAVRPQGVFTKRIRA